VLTFGPGPQINSSPVRGSFRCCWPHIFLDSNPCKLHSILTKPRQRDTKRRVYTFRSTVDITPKHICIIQNVLLGYGAERGLFLFECDRPQPNSSLVPGPETNFLFPSGVSKVVASRREISTLPWAGRIRLKSCVVILEMNQKDETCTLGIKLSCVPGQ
jgi:hypothetical protein